MKILITGATGFVGTTLIPFLYNKGLQDICLLVRNEKKAENLFGNYRLQIISTESENWPLQVSAYNPEVVLHMAAYFTGRHDEENICRLISSNITLTSLLLEAISKTNCQHFINIGTFTEFRNGTGEYAPNNFYSATKTAERPIIAYFQSISKWNWINVVVYSPYGRYNNYKKVIDYMADAMGAEKPVDFTKGEQCLDFIHVDDIADFFFTLIQKLPQLTDRYYQFHLGTGNGHTIREVGRIMEQVWHEQLNGNWGGRDYSAQDVMHAVAPIENNLRYLNWKAKINMKEGIEIFKRDIEWHSIKGKYKRN